MSEIPPFPEPLLPPREDSELQKLISPSKPDLTLIEQQAWDEGIARFQAIRPILLTCTEKELDQRSMETGVSVSTLRRWRSSYLGSGRDLLSLMRISKKSLHSQGHMNPTAEIILQEEIEKYVKDRQITPKDVYGEVKRRTKALELQQPSLATVYRRLQDLIPGRVIRGRRGLREWELKFDPLTGEAFKGVCLLDLVEGDAAVLDVMVLDDDRLRILGRPHATFFMDVFSRCILAMVIDTEAPGLAELGVGIAMAVLPKEGLLERMKLDYPWPCQGLVQTFRLDNAMAYTSPQLQRPCERWEIDIEYRMARHPETGPFIERFIQEIQRLMHSLPGTTERSPEVRGEYDSIKQAKLTLDELIRIIFIWVLGTYHQRPHSGLDGKTPLQMWDEGIHGTDSQGGIGDPRLPNDPKRFYIDFLPSVERKILRDGIRIRNLWYQSELLQDLIGVKDPNQRGGGLRLLVKYDIYDTSQIYVVDPRTKGYLVVPYRNTSNPPMTRRESLMLQRKIRERVNCPITEELIFKEREKQRAEIANAIAKTKKARTMHAMERRLFGKGNKHVTPLDDAIITIEQNQDPISQPCNESNRVIDPIENYPKIPLKPDLTRPQIWPEDTVNLGDLE